MKAFVNFVAMAIVLAICAISIYALIWGYDHLGGVYAALEAPVRTVLLTGIAAVLGATLAGVAGVRSAARIAARGRLMERRLDAYRRLLAHHVRLLSRRTPQHPTAALSPAGSDEGLEIELALIGGSAVIDAHRRLLSVVCATAPARNEIEAAFLGLLKAMRRELGQRSGIDEPGSGWMDLLRIDATPDSALA